MEKVNLGLIGYPVSHSKSDRYHNDFLSDLGLSERYGKFSVKPEQLNDFLLEAKQNAMRGLSVTMPLKECIIPLLDEVDEAAKSIGAVNTVKFINGKTFGYNTDAQGALEAIKHWYPHPLTDKKAIIVGAGGVAKAIAWVLAKAGMHIVIANRSMEKAVTLAKALNAQVCSLDALGSLLEIQCDFLIQATSLGMLDQEMIIDPSFIPSQIVVFDVVPTPQNGWLEKLSQKGCLTISGKVFWIFQAIEQYKIWYDEKLDLSSAFSIFQKSIEQKG